MAKVIEKENGEWILTSDDAPDDIVYDGDYQPPVTLQNASKNIRKNLLEPVSVLITYEEEDFQTIPLQLQSFSTKDKYCRIKGMMLTPDFSFLVKNKMKNISKIELVLEDSRSVLFESCNLTKIYSKDMNKVTSTVNLFLVKHN
jgi:tRNA nucleotidyltransferase (CCA-adding enzyme)